jgi:hypothetical protein
MINYPHFGPLTKTEIMEAIEDDEWQKFRLSLKGLSTKMKIQKLWSWVDEHEYSHDAKVQVTNYVNALKRGGQIKS